MTTVTDYGKCADPTCDKDAVSDAPRMCATHTLALFGLMGSMWENQIREAFCCPFGDWSVASNGSDPAGVEEAIREHLDEDHPGWTTEQLEQMLAARSHEEAD